MTPSAQRILIASACGWYDFGTTAPERGKLGFRVIGRNGENMDRRLIPDYLSDLNAMHEAWHTLDSKHKRMAFHEQLRRKVLSDGGHKSSTEGDIVCCCENATAAQRAEAFLRTLGKWEDDAEVDPRGHEERSMM